MFDLQNPDASAQARALEQAAERLGAEFPHSAVLQAALAEFWLNRQRLKRAAEAAQKAVQLHPQFGAARVVLAAVLIRMRRDEEAAEHLRAGGPAATLPAMRNHVAVAYAQRGDLERAAEIWEQLRRDHPEFETARANLAVLEGHRRTREAGGKNERR